MNRRCEFLSKEKQLRGNILFVSNKLKLSPPLPEKERLTASLERHSATLKKLYEDYKDVM